MPRTISRAVSVSRLIQISGSKIQFIGCRPFDEPLAALKQLQTAPFTASRRIAAFPVAGKSISPGGRRQAELGFQAAGDAGSSGWWIDRRRGLRVTERLGEPDSDIRRVALLGVSRGIAARRDPVRQT